MTGCSQRVWLTCFWRVCCPSFLLQALLAFLNTDSERLVGRHTAITSAAAAAMAAAGSHSRNSSAGSNPADADGSQQRSSRPGPGLFRAMQRGLMGLGSKLQQGLDLSPGYSEASDGQPQQVEHDTARADAAQVIKQQWLQLSQLCWCPVLADAPDAALPWRTASSRGQGHGVQRLAAPCAVRPGRDLWLCSAVKAVVDGECRSQVALAGLGW